MASISLDVSDGVRAVDLDGRSPGGVEQSFATTVGQWYLVSFDLSGNPGNGNAGTGLPLVKQARVTVDEFSQDYAFDSSGQAITALTWQSVTFAFQATDTDATLRFSSLSLDPTNAYGALVDNVSVTAVPEPSSIVLLGAGWLVTGRWRYRRSRKVGM
jgi:hypothetical protein